MSSIKEMTYRLWRRLDGGNITDDSKYTYRELVGYIRSGIAGGLKQSYFEQRNLEEFKYGDDTVSASYKAVVNYDSERELNYVDLINSTISVAGARFTGVTSLNPLSRWSTRYVPIRQEEIFVRGLQADIPCVTMFYKEDKKLYLFNQEVTEKEVRITDRYSIPTDDNADLTMPSEFENLVLDQAYKQLVAPQIPSDRANDGVPLS